MVVNVMADPDHREQAISVMLQCNRRMVLLLDHLRKKYKIGITQEECPASCEQWIRDHQREREVISHLIRDFNYENIHETRPTNGQDVAYSLNKGRSIMLCLRDMGRQDRAVNIDLLMFVTLHEAAHIANYNQWGHGLQFWGIFKYMLEEAASIGIYNPVDYAKTPQTYCGFEVNHNPFFDPRIRSLIPSN
jgi:hypothetical protein